MFFLRFSILMKEDEIIYKATLGILILHSVL